jgi:phosphoribosylglycinamide formyltransferase-1
MSARKLSIGVLVSGQGTNLQAIIDATSSGKIDASIKIVISDNPNAYALKRAEDSGLPSKVLKRSAFKTKVDFEEAAVGVLSEHGVELVCLAGFMRILGKTLLRAFPMRIINIHPALLPAFPGLNAQEQAFDYGVKVTGCTVHFVDEKTDHGPIILQEAVTILEEDTVASLKAKILKKEHEAYPKAIKLFAQGRLKIENRRVCIMP